MSHTQQYCEEGLWKSTICGRTYRQTTVKLIDSDMAKLVPPGEGRINDTSGSLKTEKKTNRETFFTRTWIHEQSSSVSQHIVIILITYAL